jgi:predicted DNA-binding transcriptional regulator AlpA
MALSNRHHDATAMPLTPFAPSPGNDSELHELLTVEDVAALLKVSRSWVYEHTRSRGTARAERLPYIKIGKYKRFDPLAVREFIRRRAQSA